MIELSIEAATADVIARHKRGTSMLVSAAVAMRRLEQRINSGEAGDGVIWLDYRAAHIEPHISRQWINQLLRLAPPEATEADVATNVEAHKKANAKAQKRSRARAKGDGGYMTLCRAWEKASVISRQRFLREYGLRPGNHVISGAA